MTKTIASCPVCDRVESFMEGCWVSVGMGEVQVSPDMCCCCGYTQAGANFNEETDLTIEQYRKCWELQVRPRHAEESDEPE